MLGDEELHTGARTALRAARVPPGPARCPDVVKGTAGSIVGLLVLASAFGEQGLVEDALTAGDALLDRATVTCHGWSWAIPGRRYPAHPCGVAHGAAGIGWAMLELFGATSDERFRAAAEGAFAYERSWLDPASGTWPDLRIGGQRRGGRGALASPAEGTWCHGEAGIALSRLRAIAVLGQGPHADDAEVALETTRRHLAGALPYEIQDLSLCHGAAGAADTLLCGAAALGGRWRAAAGVATDLGRVALDRYAGTGDDWPCGTVGTTPGLFLGLSGIAALFLRLHEPTIASPLALPIRG